MFYFESADQETVRAALDQATGFTAPDTSEKRRRISHADPHSTMVYRYEHSRDLEERMEILAEGLTSIKGTFTLEDVREIDERNAEKLLEAMLDRCIVAEVRPGVYRA